MGNVAVRGKAIDLAGLAAMEKHAKRLDTTSMMRKINDNDPLVFGSLNLREAFNEHTQNCKFNKAAKKVVLHHLVQFPTSWEITPEREQQMLDDAVNFINETHGGNAVFAARLDRDETGRHTVDVFSSPTFVKQTKQRKNAEMWVSATKHGKELCEAHRAAIERRNKGKFTTSPKSVGIAMQEALYEYLHSKYGNEIKKGNEKDIAKTDRLSPEGYKLEMQDHTIRKLTKRDEAYGKGMKDLWGIVKEYFHLYERKDQIRLMKGFMSFGVIPKDTKMDDLINPLTQSPSGSVVKRDKSNDYTPQEEYTPPPEPFKPVPTPF